MKLNDLDMEKWKEYEDLWTDSLWIIDRDDREESCDLHGRFVSQIPYQLIRRFTKPGDLIIDPFVGSGTTLQQASKLGRLSIGGDIDRGKISQLQGSFAGEITDNRVRVLHGDAQDPATWERIDDEMFDGLGKQVADLVILHPPYSNIIRFSNEPGDLSNVRTNADFYDRLEHVTYHVKSRVAPGRHVALVIGDSYSEGEWVPLGFRAMDIMQHQGYRLKSIVVKNMAGNETGKGKDMNLWRWRALQNGFYVFRHEYIFLFQVRA